MCRPKSAGGRRCPAHSTPEYRENRNARRRAAYAAKKKAGNSFTLPRLYTHTGETNTHPDYGYTITQVHSDTINPKLYNKQQISGHINPDTLTGFYETPDYYGFQDPYGENDYWTKLDTFISRQTADEASAHEIKPLTQEEQNAIRFFTSSNYKWVNRALINPTKITLGEGTSEDFHKHTTVELNRNSELEDNQRTQALLDKLTTTLDKAFKKAPKVQRTVYRGLGQSLNRSYDNVQDWAMNLQPGQTLTFDGYQSATLSPSVAVEYATSDVILEIITPEGLNITNISHFSAEQEVLLPRNQKYVVIATHPGVETGTILSQPKTIIQLLAVNDDGEILGGNL